MTDAQAPAPNRRRFVFVLRRLHLYLGLFLVPFVLLYAVTAFLFNHPSTFADRPTQTFGRAATTGTALDDYPSPQQTAEEVTALVGVRLVRPEEARFSREFAFATVNAGAQTHFVLVEVASGTGTIRTNPTPPTASAKAPFEVKGITVPDPAAARVKAAVPEILARNGIDGGEVTVTSVPDVTFLVEAEGQLWLAMYNGTTGAVTGRPVGERESPSTRSQITRLHLAHGYPGSGGARWYWALAVDAIAGAMVFWVFSGVLMWWQLRAVRLGGALALGSGVLVAGWLIASLLTENSSG